MKKFIKPFLYSLGILLVFTFILTIFNYIGLISFFALKVCKVIIPIVSYFIAGFLIGKNSDKKGWLSGIEIGLILVITSFAINLVLNTKLSIGLILYYIGLLSICVLGSMLGINRKKD